MLTAPPANPLAPEPAEIVEKRSFTSQIHSYRFRLLEPGARHRFDFVPGQFNMLYVPGVGEVALSISSDPDDEHLEHTVRIVGRTTEVIGRLGVGDVVGLRGPYGNGWPLREARYHDVLFVTGGLGCAPVTGAIQSILRRRSSYGRLTILHGVKKAIDLVHRDLFEEWRRQPRTHVLLTSDEPDRAWHNRVGVVTDLFEEVEIDAGQTLVFMCGPEVMIRLGARILSERGVREERIFVSLERSMKCAVGWCGHCQLGPAFVCKDGPIFSHAQIGRWLAVPRL